MNKVRYRIAFLAGSSVIITILIVMFIFNITIKHKTERDAYNALNSQRASANSISSIYIPETIIIPQEDEGKKILPVFCSPKEKSILNWYNSNECNDISKAIIDGNTYYILKIENYEPDEDLAYIGSYTVTDNVTNDDNNVEVSFTYSGKIGSVISYVDVTGEIKMIGQIDFFFILTALLIGTLSTISGYYIGRKLEQNQLSQKQFFENTSHELKTPLTAIQGYAEGIENGVITDLPRTGQVITAQTSKMSRMIEEILCLARIESGSVQLEKEPVYIDELIQNCLMPFEGAVQNKGLDIKLELSEVKVNADADKLEHSVSNLLLNAIKYAKTQIIITCDCKNICISNDCAPMSEDTLKHIFDRFYTGRDGNTGIGLSLAKEIIELHGWRIHAKRITDGIKFTIELK